MKGVSAVIAVILLLLITVAIVGFAFIWFGRITSLATNSTEQQITQFYQTAAKKITIDNIDITSTNISVRNVGTASIPVSEISIFVGGAVSACPNWIGNVSGTIPPGTVATCGRVPAVACTSGTRIKVTAPGGSDERSC